VISPIVRGMLGLSDDETTKTLYFAPHLPPQWDRVGLEHVSFCGGQSDILYSRRDDGIHLAVKAAVAGADCTLRFTPSFSKHARMRSMLWNGRPLQYTVEQNSNDQHAMVSLPMGNGELIFRVDDDFGLQADNELPPLGTTSVNLKISREQWSANNRELKVRVAGIGGRRYEVHAYGARIASVGGGELKQAGSGMQTIEISFASGADPGKYMERELTIRF